MRFKCGGFFGARTPWWCWNVSWTVGYTLPKKDKTEVIGKQIYSATVNSGHIPTNETGQQSIKADASSYNSWILGGSFKSQSHPCHGTSGAPGSESLQQRVGEVCEEKIWDAEVPMDVAQHLQIHLGAAESWELWVTPIPICSVFFCRPPSTPRPSSTYSTAHLRGIFQELRQEWTSVQAAAKTNSPGFTAPDEQLMPARMRPIFLRQSPNEGRDPVACDPSCQKLQRDSIAIIRYHDFGGTCCQPFHDCTMLAASPSI